MSEKHSTGRIGVHMCGAMFEEHDFIFREEAIEDYGIDAIIETKEDGVPSGKLIAVQIKSGESYFSKQDENHIVYYIDNKHRDYWINHSLPVIIALYKKESNECFWEVVDKQTLIPTKTQWKILVPKKQTINSSCKKLHEIAQNMSEYEHRHASLVFAKEWMKEAKKQGHLILEVGEWVNKTSGKGEFVLITTNDNGDEITLFNRILWGFGNKPYSHVIQEMFPWADIVIDKDFYEENMDFGLDTCWDIHDKFDDMNNAKRVVPGERIFPYCNYAGEVDRYRLVLTLNHIGQAFLTIEDFLENSKFYKIDHLA